MRIKEIGTLRQWDERINMIRRLSIGDTYCTRRVISTDTAISDFIATLRHITFVIVENISKQCMNREQSKAGLLIHHNWYGSTMNVSWHRHHDR